MVNFFFIFSKKLSQFYNMQHFSYSNSMLNKRNKHEHLVWIDLEMTGLDYHNDVILEIATIITDADLNIIATGPNLIVHHPDEVLERMDQWCTEQHTKTGLYKAVQESKLTLEQAEEQTLQFLNQYCKKGTAPLCGNTVWFDKLFLKKDMPFIYDFLHYRIVDVTSLKVMINLWTDKNAHFKKENTHRALDDIKESIAELKFYKEIFIEIPEKFKQSDQK